jgi:hypothetical protein
MVQMTKWDRRAFGWALSCANYEQLYNDKNRWIKRKRVVANTCCVKHCPGRLHWRRATKTPWAAGICHFERSVKISTKAKWRAAPRGSILKPPKFYHWEAFRVYPWSAKQVVCCWKLVMALPVQVKASKTSPLTKTNTRPNHMVLCLQV